jgi:hypothetical protein
VLEALVDDQGLETIRNWAGAEPEIIERYSGAATEGWAFGGPYHVTARVRAELTLPQGKMPAYAECVRVGMQDFIAAIRNPQHTPEVKPLDGRNSLAVAAAAARAAETGRWEII